MIFRRNVTRAAWKEAADVSDVGWDGRSEDQEGRRRSMRDGNWMSEDGEIEGIGTGFRWRSGWENELETAAAPDRSLGAGQCDCMRGAAGCDAMWSKMRR